MATATIDYALAAHNAGFTVIPPHEDGTKRPAGNWKDYQEHRPSEDQIHAWFDAGRDGFGVLCGQASGHLEMFEFEGRAMEHWPTFRERCAEHGLKNLLDRIINGYAELTPSGGIHLLWRCPDGVEGNTKLARRPSTPDEIQEDPANKIQVLIETRGEGGYTILAPSGGSVHSSGRPWTLQRGGLDSVATITARERQDLLDIARTFDQLDQPVPAPTAERPAAGTTVTADGGWFDRTVGAFNQATNWDQILEGWSRMHTSGGVTYWCRPGKNPRDGHSATTNALGTDRLIVFSSSVAGFETFDGVGKAPSYDRFGAHAVLAHHGDRLAAARLLRPTYGPADDHSDDMAALLGLAREHAPRASLDAAAEPAATEPEVEASDWSPVDLTEILAGDVERPTPTILCAPSGVPLAYPGRVNGLFGESGAGKTWIVLAAILQVIEGGGTAILIDLEDSPHGIVPRLRDMGLSAAQIAGSFAYIAPQSAWGMDAAVALTKVLDDLAPELVVIDSTGEALAMGGVKGNDDDDVARWFRRFPRLIADLGPAVMLVDHIPKDPNAPIGYAIGSQRKRAAINGAAYRVDAVYSPSRDKEGLLRLTVAKDRHGTRPLGSVAAMVKISPYAATPEAPAGGTRVTLQVPEAGDPAAGDKFRPTTLMERVSEWLLDNAGATGRDIETNVSGKHSAVRAAIQVLCEEGWITSAAGPRRSVVYAVATPFRVLGELVGDDGETGETDSHGSGEEPSEPVDNPVRPSAPQCAPPIGAQSDSSAPRLAPPYGGGAHSGAHGARSEITSAPPSAGRTQTENYRATLTPDEDDL